MKVGVCDCSTGVVCFAFVEFSLVLTETKQVDKVSVPLLNNDWVKYFSFFLFFLVGTFTIVPGLAFGGTWPLLHAKRCWFWFPEKCAIWRDLDSVTLPKVYLEKERNTVNSGLVFDITWLENTWEKKVEKN